MHNFDACRLHIEVRPDAPGCAGLPKQAWQVVLIFNTMEQCVAARQELERARVDLLERRASRIREVVLEDSN